MSFDRAYNATFTMGQIATVAALETLIETGRYDMESYGLVAVLDDGAGISYGKNQATENSGTLFQVIEEYIKRTGASWERLFPYKSRLYDGLDSQKKSALTEDEAFKSMLHLIGKEDPVMHKAQRFVFHHSYMRPSLSLADTYDVRTPLGLLAIYDICIHSGTENAAKHLETFNEQWTPPEAFDVDADGYVDEREYTDKETMTLEKAWVKDLLLWRKQWLENFKNPRSPKHTLTVRKTAYRAQALLNLAEQDLFSLDLSDGLVFSIEMPSGKKREQRYTRALVEQVEGL